MPSPPPPSCCLCPEVEYNAGTTTLKTENVIGYVTDIVLSPLLVSEDNPHCRLCEQWGVGSNNMFKFPISFTKNCFCAILTRNSGTYEVALIIKNKSTSTITWEAWNSNGKVDVVPAECLVVGV